MKEEVHMVGDVHAGFIVSLWACKLRYSGRIAITVI